MLEYVILRFLWTRLGKMLRNKGHESAGYEALLVYLWLAGEIGGFILGTVLTFDSKTGEPDWLLAVALALVGIIAAAAIVFAIAVRLPDKRDLPTPGNGCDWRDPEFGRRFSVTPAAREDIKTEPSDVVPRKDEFKAPG
jgi:hypothetical protein